MFQRALSHPPARVGSRDIVSQIARGKYVCSNCARAAAASPKRVPALTNQIAKRQYATRRPAPSTRDRLDERKPRLAGSKVQAPARPTELTLDDVVNNLKEYPLDGLEEDRVRAFCERVLAIDEKASRLRQPVDGRKLIACIDEFKLSRNASMVHWLLRLSNGNIRPQMAERCLQALSEAGMEAAIFLLLNRALLRAEDGHNTFEEYGVKKARRKAAEYMNRSNDWHVGSEKSRMDWRAERRWGVYYQYMFHCMEGRIEHKLGNTDRAIHLLERAVEFEDLTDWGGRRDEADMYEFDIYMPWQFLAEIYNERYQTSGSPADADGIRKHTEYGCKKGDPISHWQAAEFNKVHTSKGYHVPTSKWFYYCSKAAASGHLQAAYSLANFYRDSGWRYLEDDPPDYVKPTPFDHKPSEEGSSASRGPFGNVREFLRWLVTKPEGFGKFEKIKEPHEALFYTAVYPSTAAERMRLAIEWLGVAIDFHFAPAYLVKAKIHLEETLWHAANAPATALSLSDSRYDGSETSSTEVEEDPNPYYSKDAARESLREVFRACRMGEQKRWADREYLKNFSRSNTNRVVHDHYLWVAAHRENPEQAKFFLDSTVWDQFEKDLEKLEEDAKTLCREHNLDLYETDGLVIYEGGKEKEKLEAQEEAKRKKEEERMAKEKIVSQRRENEKKLEDRLEREKREKRRMQLSKTDEKRKKGSNERR